MPTRVEIRHAIVDALNTIPGLTSFYEQHIADLEKAMPCSVVFFDSIEVTEDLKGGRKYIGQLGIMTYMSGQDDDIDPLIDQIIVATDAAVQAPNPLGTAWTLGSLTYDHETQPGTTGCSLAYTIWFTD